MSALDDILGKNQAPALAQQQPGKPVTAAPKPQVDNSNAGNATNVQPKPQNTQNVTRDVGAALPKLPGITAKAETGNGSALPQNTPKQLSYAEMFQKLNPYKQPTEEELEAERKKQKRAAVFSALGDGLSALANVYFASQGSPNMGTGEGTTKKVNDRWEKLKQERRENAEKYAAGLMNAARLDEARKEAERKYNTDNRHWEMSFNLQKASNDAAANLAREKFDWEKGNKQQAFDEGVRQFNETSKQNEKRINASVRESNAVANKNVVTLPLGRGNGTVRIPADANNATNWAYVFSKLPPEIQQEVYREPLYDKNGLRVKETIKDENGNVQTVYKYKDPSLEAIQSVIGTYVQDYPEVQTALKEIAGIKPKPAPGKKNNPMGSGKKNNPMD